MSKGKFISFEGGEGTGKSTQVELLQNHLSKAGIEAILTREPGGAPGAEQIRQLLLKGDTDKWDPMTEVLLFYAARVNHLKETILPALNSGQWVICDRYADSTFAYQGAGHGLGTDIIQQIHHITTGDFWPEMTILLDIDPEKGLARATEREAAIVEHNREDRYEKMAGDYHHRLRQAFLNRAEIYPNRFRIISAEGSIRQVSDLVWQHVSTTFGLSHVR